MSEATFPVTLKNFSPLWRWSKLGSDGSQGWTVLCAATEDTYRCDDHTAQYTTTAVSANLTFYGSGIAVYGNATGGMGWSMTVDGKQTLKSDSTSGFSAQLASWTGLSAGQHVLDLQTVPGPAGSAFNLDRADVTVGTGSTGLNVSTSYVDSLSSSITYSSGYWNNFGGYPLTFQPPGVNNNNFTGANVAGEKASLVFSNASAIVWYGPCYEQCGAYSVSIDSEPAVSYNGTWDTPRVVAESCVRFMRSDMDPAKQHAITITVLEPKFVNVDYFQLFTPTNASSSSPPSHPSSPTDSHKSKSNVGAIAGGVVGGVGALIVALILFFFWRRRRSRKDQTIRPEPFSSDSVAGGEKPMMDEENGPAGVVNHASSDPLSPFPPDSHWAGIARTGAVQFSSPNTATSTTTTDVGSLSGLQRGRVSTDDSVGISPTSLYSPTGAAVVAGAGTGTTAHPPLVNTHPLPNSPFNPASFSPDRVDYRPPEKSDFGGAATVSSRSRGVARTPHPDTTSPGVTGALSPNDASENRNRSDTISSFPLSVDASTHSGRTNRSSRRGGTEARSTTSPIAPTTATGETPRHAGVLTQISQDVNRILTTLGRLRITPGEPVDEDEFTGPHDAYEAHPTHGVDLDDGASPPEYGEEVAAGRQARPLPTAPASNHIPSPTPPP